MFVAIRDTEYLDYRATALVYTRIWK